MTKEQKAKVIADTVERIERASGMYMASFSGLTVEKANELRSKFFEVGVDYVVVKNTLLKLALEQVGGYDEVLPYLVNQTGVAFSYDDPIQPARILKDSRCTDSVQRKDRLVGLNSTPATVGTNVTRLSAGKASMLSSVSC